MDWDGMRLVLTLARAGTLSAASRELDVNHTTVSRQLSALEKQLGVRLFDRTPGGYVATAAGEDMIAVATRVEDDIIALDRRLSGRDARLAGPLRVSTLDLFAVQLAQALAQFAEQYPAVDLVVSATGRPVDLDRRQADVALRLTRAPAEHLVGHKLANVAYALYGSHELVAEAPTNGEPWAALPWIAWAPHCEARLTDAFMRERAPNAPRAYFTDSSTVYFHGVRSGHGLGFLPCVLGDAAPEVQQLRPPEPGFDMDLWVLTHPDLRKTARVQAFMSHMSAYCRERHAAFTGVRRVLDAGA